jgi:hypothetical protein
MGTKPSLLYRVTIRPSICKFIFLIYVKKILSFSYKLRRNRREYRADDRGKEDATAGDVEMAVISKPPNPGAPPAELVEERKKVVVPPNRERLATPPKTLPKPNWMQKIEAVVPRPPKIPPRPGEIKILLFPSYYIFLLHPTTLNSVVGWLLRAVACPKD